MEDFDFQSKRDKFLATYRNQTFSLPKSIMFYIAKNPPNQDTYHEMVQCCKYFFIKNPIVLFKILNLKRLPTICYSNNSTKLWVSDEFAVPEAPSGESYQNLFSKVISKFYHKWNVDRLFLYDISLSFDEYLFLSSSATLVQPDNVSIKYSNGDEVQLEKLVQVCPKASAFEYAFSSNPSNFSSETINELIEMPHFLNMSTFGLYRIHDSFDVRPLIEFWKMKRGDFRIHFSESISDDYWNQIYKIVFEIIATGNFIYGPPRLTLPGLSEQYQKALYDKSKK